MGLPSVLNEGPLTTALWATEVADSTISQGPVLLREGWKGTRPKHETLQEISGQSFKHSTVTPLLTLQICKYLLWVQQTL